MSNNHLACFVCGTMMNPIAMQLRNVTSVQSIAVSVDQHTLSFRGASGIASLTPSSGSTAHGVVHFIDKNDAHSLNNVFENNANRVTVMCRPYDAGLPEFPAIACIIEPSGQPDELPSERYLDILCTGAIKFVLHSSYIDWLQEHSCVPRRAPADFKSFPVAPKTPLMELSAINDCDGTNSRPLRCVLNDKVLEFVGEQQGFVFEFARQNYACQDITQIVAKFLYDPLYEPAFVRESMSAEHCCFAEDVVASWMSSVWRCVGVLATMRPPSFRSERPSSAMVMAMTSSDLQFSTSLQTIEEMMNAPPTAPAKAEKKVGFAQSAITSEFGPLHQRPVLPKPMFDHQKTFKFLSNAQPLPSSPAPTSNPTICKHFPTAVPASRFVDAVVQCLERDGTKLSAANVKLVHSTCNCVQELSSTPSSSDSIDVLTLLARRCGLKSAVALGSSSAGGLPLDGLQAFQTAVKSDDSPTLILFYASHIDAACLVDNCHSCLAVQTALAKSPDPDSDWLNIPASILSGALLSSATKLLSQPVSSTVSNLCNTIGSALRSMLQAHPYTGRVALIGGVQIHASDSPFDWFAPQRFDIIIGERVADSMSSLLPSAEVVNAPVESVIQSTSDAAADAQPEITDISFVAPLANDEAYSDDEFPDSDHVVESSDASGLPSFPPSYIAKSVFFDRSARVVFPYENALFVSELNSNEYSAVSCIDVGFKIDCVSQNPSNANWFAVAGAGRLCIVHLSKQHSSFPLLLSDSANLVDALAFSIDGALLVAAERNSTSLVLSVHDWKQRRLVLQHVAAAHERVHALSFNPNIPRELCCLGSACVTLYQLDDSSGELQLRTAQSRAQSERPSLCSAYSNKGTNVVGGTDGSVSAFVGGFRKKVWLNHHSAPITALQTFPDGVITAAKGVVQFCNSKMEPTSQLSTGQNTVVGIAVSGRATALVTDSAELLLRVDGSAAMHCMKLSDFVLAIVSRVAVPRRTLNA